MIENNPRNAIPLWAFIFMVAIMIALGIFANYEAVQGFMNDVSFGRSNRVLPRADYPYSFWIRNIFMVIIGNVLLILAIWMAKIRYKQLKSSANIQH